MTPDPLQQRWSPFPAAPGFECRAFGGQAIDLAVDFSASSSAELTTQILASCLRTEAGAALERDVLWDLPVGQRLAWLLAIATHGASWRLPLTFACAAPDCGTELEVELEVSQLLEHQRAQQRTFERGGGPSESHTFDVPLAGRQVSVEVPRGRHLAGWSAADGTVSREQMVRDLVSERDRAALPPALPQEWLARVEAALAQWDPLVDFEIRSACPACGADNRHGVDLQSLALQRLARARQALLLTVHRLASVYHWSEAEILAMPPGRRAEYLSLLDRVGA